MANRAWPDEDDLAAWIPDGANLSVDFLALLPDLIADATDAILERIDTGKLPDGYPDGETCPRTIWRAVLLEAAHLGTRRDSANGVVAFGEYTIRVNVDRDIAELLKFWRLDPEP